ncbi:PspC domain-containing protein [Clostridia bacterium]|nr:PspC domain-containing protein [Clostridia bacterium]
MAEKKLAKSKDKKIFGVCGGVAEYFNIDPTVIRLIWALAILVYGTGFLLYIIMAIIMPDPQKVEEEKSQAKEDVEEIIVEVDDVAEEDKN